MKKNNNHFLRAGIATGVALIALIMLISFCSFKAISKTTDELWKQLGISQQDGTEKIRNSFLEGYFDYAGVKNITTAATGNRTTIVKDLLMYARQYISSKNFQNEYEKMRQEAKPAQSQVNIRTKEEIRKEQIDDTQKQIAKTEAIIKDANADMKKIMQPILDMHKKNLKDYQDPNSQTINLLYQTELMKQRQDSAQYQKALKNWQENYPADYRQLIKMRLQHYIDVASTVDFSAALKAEGGRMKFVNNAYEAKNNEWKMIYRSGREINEAAINFSRTWLAELGH
ncbi:MAG TPA: hypothetical protein VHB48_10135 [Chitinophagaceae bacterium]|nr:hypothetical protein [Chitinophagaceae bacterium]